LGRSPTRPRRRGHPALHRPEATLPSLPQIATPPFRQLERGRPALLISFFTVLAAAARPPLKSPGALSVQRARCFGLGPRRTLGKKIPAASAPRLAPLLVRRDEARGAAAWRCPSWRSPTVPQAAQSRLPGPAKTQRRTLQAKARAREPLSPRPERGAAGAVGSQCWCPHRSPLKRAYSRRGRSCRRASARLPSFAREGSAQPTSYAFHLGRRAGRQIVARQDASIPQIPGGSGPDRLGLPRAPPIPAVSLGFLSKRRRCANDNECCRPPPKGAGGGVVVGGGPWGGGGGGLPNVHREDRLGSTERPPLTAAAHRRLFNGRRPQGQPTQRHARHDFVSVPVSSFYDCMRASCIC